MEQLYRSGIIAHNAVNLKDLNRLLRTVQKRCLTLFYVHNITLNLRVVPGNFRCSEPPSEDSTPTPHPYLRMQRWWKERGAGGGCRCRPVRAIAAAQKMCPKKCAGGVGEVYRDW